MLHTLRSYFISAYKHNSPLFLAINQIEKGSIKANLIIDYTNEKKNHSPIKAFGQITDLDLNLLNNQYLEKISFGFNIENEKYIFDNLRFEYNKIPITSKKIQVIKKEQDYIVEGNLINSKYLVDPNNLFSIFKVNFDLLSKKNVLIESDNNFSFKVNNNKKIENLKIKSMLKFDKLFLNKKYTDLFYFKNGIINTKYEKNNLLIEVSSKYSFFKDKIITSKELSDDIKIFIDKKNNNFLVKGNFKHKKNFFDIKNLVNLLNIDEKFFSNKNKEVSIESENKFNFIIDRNNKINNLKIQSNLKFDKLNIVYKSNRIKKYLKDYQDNFIIKEGNLLLDYSGKSLSVKGTSKYSIDKNFDDLEFDILKSNNDYKLNAKINLNNSSLKIDEINYFKEKDKISSLKFKGNILNSNIIIFDEILFTENKNIFKINQMKLNDYYKVLSIDKLVLNYDNSNKIKNNIILSKINNNYILEGDTIDFSKYLIDILENDDDKSLFSNFKNLNSILNIDIQRLYLDKQNYLVNLNGEFKFVNNKIRYANLNSKFQNGEKFLFSIKSTSNNEMITKLNADRAKPFVSNYKFIKGFQEGVIDFHSVKKNNVSKSVLKIHNFKVREVPVLAQLLTLASLQGIADSLTGEGIRFTDFEMIFSNENDLMTIEEMYSIGPAISILMEGYAVRNKLISLRGTLVPAKTINRTIASIPVIGDILIGKKVGEGVFGVSFKIKGPPKDLRSTVNPVKTLTPRFITRTLEKLKKN